MLTDKKKKTKHGPQPNMDQYSQRNITTVLVYIVQYSVYSTAYRNQNCKSNCPLPSFDYLRLPHSVYEPILYCTVGLVGRYLATAQPFPL